MAERRRKWQDNLRNECKTEKSPKKPKKIKMLKEKVYKEQNEELVLLKSINYLKESQGDIVKECSNSPPPLQKENATTPHQKPSDVENLTPTFRKPENYLAATADFLNKISPKSDQINMINTSCEEHNNINSCMTNQRQYNTKEIENKLQQVNTIQCTSTEVDTLAEEDKNELDSQNWGTFESCEVEVFIEPNFESNYDGNKNAETKKSMIPNLKIEDQARNEKVLEEGEIMEIDNVTLTKKTMIGAREQSALLAETSDEIRFASDSAQSADEELNPKRVVRRSKRKLNFNKSYLDFVDDDPYSLLLNEAFPSEESNIDLKKKRQAQVLWAN